MENPKAIYAQGELDKVRSRLSVSSEEEAKRMQGILGGEIGVEKPASPQPPSAAARAGALVKDARRPPSRPVGIADAEENPRLRQFAVITQKPSWKERARLDAFAARSEFRVKSAFQAFLSRIMFWRRPADLVNSYFVKERLSQYYKKFELLTGAARSLLPRNNRERALMFGKQNPFAFSVLDAIRQWKVDVIMQEIVILQRRSRQVFVTDTASLLREIFRPLYILDLLEHETHITASYRALLDFLDNNTEQSPAERLRNEERMVTSLAAFRAIRDEVAPALYPLLLKLGSDRYIVYNDFFIEKHDWYLAFLDLNEQSQILPPETRDAAIKETQEYEKKTKDEEASESEEEKENARKEKREKEGKALALSCTAVETLFPEAPWGSLKTYPDIYTPLKNTLSFYKNSDLLSPADPALQALALSLIVQEFSYAFRHVHFTSSEEESPGEEICEVLSEWGDVLSESFERLYIPRIEEYSQACENSGGKMSEYTQKLQNDIHWLRRVCFFPFYRFTTVTPPTFRREGVGQLHPLTRALRRSFTVLAQAIDEANQSGGQESGAGVKFIANPWEAYNFEVENPVSKRLDAALSPQKRTNVSLAAFTLAVVTLLDHLLNSENSWAYPPDKSAPPMFR